MHYRHISSTGQWPSSSSWKKLRTAAELGHGQEAEEALMEMIDNIRNGQAAEHQLEQRQLDPSAVSLTLIAWGSTRDAHAAEHAYSLLERMNKVSTTLDDANIKSSVIPRPSREDYHAVMKCWSRRLPSTLAKQAGKRANRLLQAMEAETDRELNPNSETFELYTTMLVNSGHASQAQKFLVDRFNKHISSSSSTNGNSSSQTATVVQPTLVACNIVLSGLSRTPHVTSAKAAEEFLMQMNRYFENGWLDEKPNLESYNAVIDCWSVLSKSIPSKAFKELEFVSERAHFLFDNMKKVGIYPTASAYASVIFILARAGLAERAERLLSRLVLDYSAQFDADLKPRIKPFQDVLLAWSKSDYPQAAYRAESFLKNMVELHDAEVFDTKPDLYCYNYVLHCWAKSDDVAEAGSRSLEILEQMQDRDVTPDTTSINLCLEAYALGNTLKDTEALLSRFCNKHLEDPTLNPRPDIISFTILMKSWSASDSPEAPDQIMSLLNKLQNLKQYGWDSCKPDATCFSIAINCWGSSRREDAAERAEDMLKLMRGGDMRIQPDNVCWNGVINAWALQGNGERAEAVFEEMLRSYLNGEHSAQPCKVTFAVLMSAWAKTRFNSDAPKRARKVLQTMNELHRSGVIDAKPSVHHYTIMLDCLAYAKATWAAKIAEDYLREMAASDDPDLRPNLATFNVVLKGWSYARSPKAVDRATKLLDELVHLAEGSPKMQRQMQKSFGSVLKTIADSKLPKAEKIKRAEGVVSTMERFCVERDDWIKLQLELCQQGRSSRHQRWPKQQP